jgi:peptidoglycan/LPS O-acetylase OafA/YrhL
MIKSLEGGRGIAALITALYHLQIDAQSISAIRNGYLFVDLFFVLSGFVICAAYGSRMQTAQNLRSFVIRRIGRLLPLLVFSTIVFVFLVNAIAIAKEITIAHGYSGALNNPHTLNYLIPSAAEVISTLTMTHSMGVFDRLILNTPSWSISTEFYTYLLFAAVCLLLTGTARRAAFFVLGMVGFAVSVWASVHVHHCALQGACLALTYDFGFARSVYSFFLGALVFHASRAPCTDPVKLQWPGLALLMLLLALVDNFPLVALVFPLVFALLIFSVHSETGPLAKILRRKPFQILGQRSYSIYLMHMPLVLLFENIAKRVDGFAADSLVLLAYVTTLITVSGWTFKYVEDPFRAIFNRLAADYGVPSQAGNLLNSNRRLD